MLNKRITQRIKKQSVKPVLVEKKAPHKTAYLYLLIEKLYSQKLCLGVELWQKLDFQLGNVQISYDGVLSNFRLLPPI